jgi:hypothetical protein
MSTTYRKLEKWLDLRAYARPCRHRSTRRLTGELSAASAVAAAIASTVSTVAVAAVT